LPSITVTAISGLLDGAKAANHEYMRVGCPPISVPVLAATPTPGRAREPSGWVKALAAVPRRAVSSSIWVIERATCGDMARPAETRAVGPP
jgi:hypothetical protein